MARPTNNPAHSTKRMASYHERMRSSGLRPVQIWVPDTRSADFVEECQRQARAVAAHDPAGDEIMHFLEGLRDWPKA
jgi:hypothetical protein